MSQQNQANYPPSPDSPRVHVVYASPPGSPGVQVPAHQPIYVAQPQQSAPPGQPVYIVQQAPGDKTSSGTNFDWGMFFLGLLLSMLFTLLSLIGFCVIKDSVRRKSYGIGWLVGFVLGIVVGVVLYFTVYRYW